MPGFAKRIAPGLLADERHRGYLERNTSYEVELERTAQHYGVRRFLAWRDGRWSARWLSVDGRSNSQVLAPDGAPGRTGNMMRPALDYEGAREAAEQWIEGELARGPDIRRGFNDATLRRHDHERIRRRELGGRRPASDRSVAEGEGGAGAQRRG
jgi:hypothetical protein